MEAVKTVRWLRDCLREDRARRGIRDFTSSRIEARRFLTGAETLATDALPSEVVGVKYAQRLCAKLESHGRHREAVYGTLFVVGRWMDKSWCAPVLLYPALVSAEGVAAITLAEWKLNSALRDELDLDDEFEDDLEGIVGSGVLSVGVALSVAERLQRALPELGGTRLLDFPDLAKTGELEARKKRVGLELFPASAIGLAERSRGVAGILHELDQLTADDSDWSAPLRALFGPAAAPAPARREAGDLRQVPAVLSEAQERIVRSARRNTMTLCHGPPGTGKSFTIAAVAVDHIVRGESVLIASEKDHAVDVAAEKIREMMGGSEVTVRAGRSGYLRTLKRFLEDCLSGLVTANASTESAMEEARKGLDRTLKALANRERWLSQETASALETGELMADRSPSWWRKLRQGLVRRRLSKRPLLMELSSELEHSHQLRIRQARRHLKIKRDVLLWEAVQHAGIRGQLRTFLRALRRRSPGAQEAELREVKWEGVLSALPIWLVRLSDAHRVLPLRADLFDVVIIDEATQCDLASALPVLQRARRVVVAGDERQLRHVPFVSRGRMQAMARAHRLASGTREFYDYRKRSLMDVAIDRALDHDQIGFLNEHFRSRRAIITFSNDRFYRGAMTLMTDRPWAREEGVLTLEACDGQRDDNGVNGAEIERVIEVLKALVDHGASEGTEPLPTIGILSPFRNQVESLRQRIERELGPERFRRLAHAHRLLLGTAHSFQGEERDVMMISWTVAPDTSHGVLRFLERPDVFNVSITRARNHQRVFTSVRPADLPRPSLLADYLHHAAAASPGRPAGEGLDDRFADEVEAALTGRGCRVRRAIPVAGVAIDLLAVREAKAVGIDLIGHPGELQEAVEQDRIRVLARAGFPLLPLGLAEWRTRPEDVVREVLSYLK